MSNTIKNNTGTNKAGSISTVLNCRIFSKENPAAMIKNPPTIDSSVIKVGEKKLADRNFAIR